jgi:hypothetical protein
MKILEKIKKTSQKLGISIKKPHLIAKKYLKSEIDYDSFFAQKYDAFDFLVHFFKNHPKYSTLDEKNTRKLFCSDSIFEIIRNEYPPWRENQEQKAADRQKYLQKKAIRENYPQVCPQCSARMQGATCPNCRGFYAFNEATMTYVFNPTLQFDGLTHRFMRLLEEKNKHKAAASGNAAEVASG